MHIVPRKQAPLLIERAEGGGALIATSQRRSVAAGSRSAARNL